MDASPSASGNGFDAALRALEDLETSTPPVHEEGPAPVAPAVEPVGSIGFSDAEEEGAAVAIVAVPAAEPAAPPVSVEPVAASAEPAPAVVERTVEAPVPTHAAATPVAGKFTKIAIGLGLISSVVSAAGLVVAERTIMSAQLVVADARERQRQLEHANKLIEDLQVVRDKQLELLRAQQAQLAAGPVSSTELQHRLEALQAALLARDPLNDVMRVVREAQADNNARFNEIGLKIERFERVAGGGH